MLNIISIIGAFALVTAIAFTAWWLVKQEQDERGKLILASTAMFIAVLLISYVDAVYGWDF